MSAPRVVPATRRVLQLKVDSLSFGRDRGAVSWVDGEGERYHMWVSIPALEIDARSGRSGSGPTIYCNSVAKHGAPGYHETRYMRADAAAHERMVSGILERVRSEDLIAKAFAAADEADRKRAEEQKARAREIRAEERAGRLVASLRAVLADHRRISTVDGASHSEAEALLREIDGVAS